jgi:hypothetical protein
MMSRMLRLASERQCLKEPEREVRELRRSNDIQRQTSAYFAQTEPTGCGSLITQENYSPGKLGRFTLKP